MRLYTFEVNGERRIGAEQGDRIVDLTASGLPRSMLELLQAGDAAIERARQVAAEATVTHVLRDVRLLAPIPRPPKILCSGVNYRSHQEENPGATLPETPGFFAKLPTAVIGPGAPIIHPKISRQVDYEV